MNEAINRELCSETACQASQAGGLGQLRLPDVAISREFCSKTACQASQAGGLGQLLLRLAVESSVIRLHAKLARQGGLGQLKLPDIAISREFGSENAGQASPGRRVGSTKVSRYSYQ
jgi:hypothetical protein